MWIHGYSNKRIKTEHNMEQLKVDGVLCINLREREDRRQEAEECFEEVGLKAEFYTAERHPGGGQFGCTESHRACMQLALDRNWKNCLITEDDLSLLHMPSANEMEQVNRFLQNIDVPWTILFLGHSPCIKYERTHSLKDYSIIRRVHALEAHAYIASRAWMEAFVHMPYSTHRTIVDAIFSILDSTYAVYPVWFYQSASPSDLSGPRSILMHPKVVQQTRVRMRTAYAQYVNVPTYWIWSVISIAAIVFLLLYLLLLLVRRLRKRPSEKNTS